MNSSGAQVAIAKMTQNPQCALREGRRLRDKSAECSTLAAQVLELRAVYERLARSYDQMATTMQQAAERRLTRLGVRKPEQEAVRVDPGAGRATVAAEGDLP
jgi:hypothetical protein